MATNNGNGVVNAPSGANKDKGISSAIDQAGYRREFNDRVFSDNGYLKSSIKDLEAQAKELQKVLSSSKELSAAEKKRYNDATNNMKKLAAQLSQMYKSQEVSSNELFSTLNESIKVRQKAVDDLYKHYMKKEKDLTDVGKKQVENKIEYFASKTRELKSSAEEINEASKKFNESQKSFSKGVDETLDKIQKGFGEFSKILNLQSIASNQWLEKANERYDIINQMNMSLGYGTELATNAYNSAVNNFSELNKKVDNLFGMSDMKQYLQNSEKYGLLNEELLQKNLDSSIKAEKYLGLTSDTQASLYRYMRLTNNNEAIANYNKTMIALQKEGIGVNKDMLNSMIQQNVEVSDVLSAAGLSGETLEQFNNERNILNAQIGDKYGQEYATQINNLVNESIKKLATTEGNAQLAQMGINPSTFESILATGDASKLYDYVISGVQGMSDSWSGGIRSNMMFQNQLGLNTGDVNAARKIGSDGIDNLGAVTDEIKEEVKNMTQSDEDDYLKNNVAISDIQKGINGIESWVEKTFGGSSWLNFETIGTAAFTAYLASSALNVGKSILSGGAKLLNWITGGKLASALATAFGGKLSGVVTKFFGSTSTIGKSAANLTTSGAGGKALGALGTAGVVVGLTAATIGALGAYFTGKREEAYQSQYSENLDALKGTAYEGNNGVASADTIVSSSNSMTGFGTAMSNTTNGLGYFFEGFTTKDKNTRNKSLTKWMYQNGTFVDRDSVMAWALAMDVVGSLQSLRDLGFNFTTDDIKKYMSTMDKEGKIDTVWGYINEFLGSGWHPYKDNNNGRIKTYNDFVTAYNGSSYGDDTSWEGYHKAGLDRVPRDGYKAILHKNEMILNERDADSYRKILSEINQNRWSNQNLIKYKSITGQDYATQNASSGMGGAGLYNFNGHIVGIGGGGRDLSYKPYPITAGYPTYPSGSLHRGVDFGYPSGTPIGSASSGVVVGVNADGSAYGNHVKVQGDNGLYYLYAHMTKTAVSKGQSVTAGQLLGYSGNTGNSTGPHLHYEVRNGEGRYKQDIDPYPYITSSLWNIGDSSGVSVPDSSGDSSDSSTNKSSGITLATPNTTSRRAIPGIGGPELNSNNVNNVDRIVNSVDGVSAKIIKYLDEIRQEQESQRSLIRAFSNAQNMLDMG